ncbi:hypothetical protein TWF694_011322 [Orbilia ellipsospora]|uniref:Sodium bile acid cotransporter n=1 Tax=Orbilia ellipsospora TaxID=2528407 RepID=A0AAV9XB43_9PEZI
MDISSHEQTRPSKEAIDKTTEKSNKEPTRHCNEESTHILAQETSNEPSKAWRRTKRVVEWILDKWLVIGICIAAIAGYFAPNVAKPHGYIHSEWSIIYGAVAVIFFISGLSIETERLLIHFSNWRLHLTVQGLSFLFIPTIFFCIVVLIAEFGNKAVFDRRILVGMIATGCIPTTLNSNIIMTRLSGGDDAAALVSVTVGNLLGPFITPILITDVFWPTMDKSFDSVRPASNIHELKSLYADVFKQIGLTVLLPLALGQLVQGYFTSAVASKWVKKLFLNRISTFCLTLLVWTAFSSCFATDSLQKMPKEFLILVIFVNIGLYIFFTALCVVLCRVPIPYPAFHWKEKKFYIKRLKPLDRGVFIAVCFCAPAKTTGLGLPMVTAMWTRFSDDTKAKIQIAVVLYTIEQIFIAQALVWWFGREKKRNPPPEANQQVTEV